MQRYGVPPSIAEWTARIPSPHQRQAGLPPRPSRLLWLSGNETRRRGFRLRLCFLRDRERGQLRRLDDLLLHGVVIDPRRRKPVEVSPDAELDRGALERVADGGLQPVAAVGLFARR